MFSMDLTVETTLCSLNMFSLTCPFCLDHHIFIISHTRDTKFDDTKAAEYRKQISQLAQEANLIPLPRQ